MTKREIFIQAQQCESAEERARFLAEACGDDAELRTDVESLLGFDREDAFLEAPAVEPTDAVIGTMIGPYKVLQSIGEGGMGVVYMAEQRAPLQRKVALKIIKVGMDTKEVIARFEAERQALALMDHPNIARVLDAGETESGRPFFAMELVKGVPLTEFCDQNKLPTDQRLKLFITVCRAVQHAHQKGIIHRDLKPRNVMVTFHDNKPVPKIIDFGVAKAIGQQLTEKTMFTLHGQMIGTPAYMSPEQAQLSGLDIDTRSDVYSLGVLLYELLTGTTPLDAQRIRSSAFGEVQRLIAEEEAPKPSTRVTTMGEQQALIAKQRDTDSKRLQQFLRGDLDWIVMKALEKERNRRYATADNFAEDVERFLKDDAIMARPPSTAYRLGKLARRHKAAVIGGTAIAAALVIGTAVSMWQAIEASKQRHIAERAFANEQEARTLATTEATLRRHELYASNMQLADRIWNSPEGNQRDVERLLTEWIPPNDSEPDLREFSWRVQWSRLHTSSEILVFDASAATISPNGKLITADAKGVHEWQDNEQSVPLWLGDATKAILSPDGQRAAIPGPNLFQLINLNARATLCQLPGKRCAFSPGGTYILTWNDETAQTWDAQTGELAFSHEHYAEIFRSLSEKRQVRLSPDGRSVLIHHPFKYVTAYMHGVTEPVAWTHRSSLQAFQWSRNGQLMASGDYGGQIYILPSNNASFEHRLVIPSQGRSADVIAFSSDSTQMAMGSRDGTITLYDVSGALRSELPIHLRTLKGHVDGIQSLTFSATNQHLASIDREGIAKLWNLSKESESYLVGEMAEGAYEGLLPIKVDRQQDDSNRITLFRPKAGPELKAKLNVGDQLLGLADPPDGPLTDLTGWSSDRIREMTRGPVHSEILLKLMDAQGDSRSVIVKRIKAPEPRSARVAFAPDGKSLAIADLRIGTTYWSPTGHLPPRRFPARSLSVEFDPSGQFLAMMGVEDLMLWDVTRDRLHARWDAAIARKPVGENEALGSIAWSPDGRFVAVGTGYSYSGGGEIKQSDLNVWDVESGQRISDTPLFTSTKCLTNLTFTPDGRWLVVLDHDGTIRLWNTATWQLEREFETNVRSWVIAISPDGSTLAIGGTGWFLLDFETGTLQKRVVTAHGPMAIAYSPDGRTLVTGGRDNTVRLWGANSGRQLCTFYAHRDLVYGTKFSPDGNTLVTVGTDGVLNFWKAEPFEVIDSHRLTLRALVNMASVRLEQGSAEEAEAILRDVLPKQEALLPSDHPDLAKTREMMDKARTRVESRL